MCIVIELYIWLPKIGNIHPIKNCLFGAAKLARNGDKKVPL